ncbi:MAG: serine/threonine protein kinase [Acidimicrobiia bacterium]|nr:serine/threonine protein kinase [Acidimicrobiia bacterium]
MVGGPTGSNRYRKDELRYRGGQGEVWIGRRVSDERLVAIKYLHDNPASADPQSDRRRFIREIRCQTNLQHPNIMSILASNTKARPPWYAMPWADTSLRGFLVLGGGPLSEEDALAIFRDILSAIEFAHQEGILHRDLKPENVLRFEGRWCVSDFGLSRLLDSDSTTLTFTNAALGTVAYSAPEQFSDAHSADARSDVYALGKILYEMLTGKMPFPSLDLSQLPSRYRHIVSRCIADEPGDRYQTVVDLLRQIETLVESPSDLEPPLQRAQMLLDKAARKFAALAEIDRILTEYATDEVLYTKLVPYLPRPVLESYYKRHRQSLFSVLRQFDLYISGGLPWSYTDTVADFMRHVFDICEEEEIRRLVLKRVLLMGSDHHRFHVRDVFISLVMRRSDESHVMMVSELLATYPVATAFVAEFLRGQSIPEVIRRALD